MSSKFYHYFVYTDRSRVGKCLVRCPQTNHSRGRILAEYFCGKWFKSTGDQVWEVCYEGRIRQVTKEEALAIMLSAPTLEEFTVAYEEKRKRL